MHQGRLQVQVNSETRAYHKFLHTVQIIKHFANQADLQVAIIFTECNHSRQGRIGPVRLGGGAISVLFGNQVS